MNGYSPQNMKCRTNEALFILPHISLKMLLYNKDYTFTNLKVEDTENQNYLLIKQIYKDCCLFFFPKQSNVTLAQQDQIESQL